MPVGTLTEENTQIYHRPKLRKRVIHPFVEKLNGQRLSYFEIPSTL